MSTVTDATARFAITDDAVVLTTGQQETVNRFEQPYVVRAWADSGTINAYVYQVIFVVRYFIAVDGSIISSDQFHASAEDRRVRAGLLAVRYGA